MEPWGHEPSAEKGLKPGGMGPWGHGTMEPWSGKGGGGGKGGKGGGGEGGEGGHALGPFQVS